MHFSARKNVLEYDDVMNLQRKAIYEERNAILDGKDVSESIPEIIDDSVAAIVADSCPRALDERRVGCEGHRPLGRQHDGPHELLGGRARP